MNFYKIVASGNDFIVIDNRRHVFTDKKLIKQLCALHTGIGADGILLLENSRRADFRMRIFNPDSSEPDMCGNGSRCIALFAWKQGLIRKKFTIETGAGIIRGEICPKNNIKIYLGMPKDIKPGKKISTINTGVPHAIIYTPNINTIDVEKLGRKIRWLRQFQPEGTNVDFMQVLGKNRISVRTYERGIEGETLACGTGAVASAVLSGLKSPVYVETRSGDTLVVDTKEISLTGPARIIFKGRTL